MSAEAIARIGATALVAEARDLVATWDRRGSWTPDSPVGLVDRLAGAVESLFALIPESPIDDEREAVAALVRRERGGSIREAKELAEAVLALPELRRRGLGPITDEAVERGYNAALSNGAPALMVRRSDIRAALAAAYEVASSAGER